MTLKFAARIALLLSIVMSLPGMATQHPAGKAIAVVSPDKKLRAEPSVTNGVLSYRVTADGKQVLASSQVGIQVDDVELGQDVTLDSPRVRKIDEQYHFFGVHATAINRANEAVILAQSHGESYFVDVHVANDGVGIRLRLPAKWRRKRSFGTNFARTILLVTKRAIPLTTQPIAMPLVETTAA